MGDPYLPLLDTPIEAICVIFITFFEISSTPHLLDMNNAIIVAAAARDSNLGGGVDTVDHRVDVDTAMANASTLVTKLAEQVIAGTDLNSAIEVTAVGDGAADLIIVEASHKAAGEKGITIRDSTSAQI